MAIELVESFSHIGRGHGGFWEDRGYEWYAGIWGRNVACHRAYACGVTGREVLVRAWNILGLLDLAVAVTTGFLTSPSPLQMYSFDLPNELITAYPLVLVPVFGVPLAVLLHVASLIKLARLGRCLQSIRKLAARTVSSWCSFPNRAGRGT
jgi:hypothetical protein